MMHCDRCNIDFPEGLRYCKWCGQTLHLRRVTGELQTCPSCFANVQSGWGFCKACGAQLAGQVNEPLTAVCPRCNAAAEPGAPSCVKCGQDLTRSNLQQAVYSDSTSILAHCQTCGEEVDPGSMYCKACGSALYEQPTPYGASAMLCSTCNSYSPVGSTVCRVCGTLFPQASQPRAASAGGPATADRRRSSTLPDLEDHYPPESVSSGANTYTLDSDASRRATGSRDRDDDSQDQVQTTLIPPKRGAETSVLPGATGSKSEQQNSTHVFHKSRSTSPVDEEGPPKPEETAKPAGEPSKADRASSPFATRIDTPSGFFFEEPQPGSQPEAKADLPATDEPAAINDGTSTIIFASGLAAPSAFESEDHQPAPGQKDDARRTPEEVLDDGTTTAKFGSIKIPDEQKSKAQLQDRTVELRSVEKPLAQPESPTTPIGIPPAPVEPRPVVEPNPLITKPEPVIKKPEPPVIKSEPVIKKPEPVVVAQQPGFATTTQAKPGAPVVGAQKSSSKAVPIIIVVLLLAGVGFGAWWFLLKPKPSAPEQPTATTSQPTAEPSAPPATPAPSTPTAPAPTVPEGMALVEGGTYAIGRGKASDIEGPEFPVELSSFYIDKTEVTNADYKKFIDANPGHAAPTNWVNRNYPDGRDDYPVTGVTWQDAADYANWAGKRLPTEEEWEAAARGTDKRRYPWGNDWRAGLANTGLPKKDYNSFQYPTEIKPAGQFPDGATPEGVLDLVGNVWEWTAGEVRLYPESRATLLPNVQANPSAFRVIRGGAFDADKPGDAKRYDGSYRGFLEKDQSYPKVGFRCVKDAN